MSAGERDFVSPIIGLVVLLIALFGGFVGWQVVAYWQDFPTVYEGSDEFERLSRHSFEAALIPDGGGEERCESQILRDHPASILSVRSPKAFGAMVKFEQEFQVIEQLDLGPNCPVPLVSQCAYGPAYFSPSGDPLKEPTPASSCANGSFVTPPEPGDRVLVARRVKATVTRGTYQLELVLLDGSTARVDVVVR